MTDLNQQKKDANNFRKLGQLSEALPIYKELWAKTGDAFDGAGLLQCLRKMQLFNEAIPLADGLLQKYPDFQWGRNESIWTYIQGVLNDLDENISIRTLVEKASYIMSLNPDTLAAKYVVFKVLKSAKSSNHWEIVNEWVTKIDPSSLSTNAMVTDMGKEGWSEQSQWYNYRIRGLLEKYTSQEELNEALAMTEDAIRLFPKQNKFFLRLKALSHSQSGRYKESAEIYYTLCSRPHADWWLLHEYAKVLQAQALDEDALRIMYRAASCGQKLESMVTLFLDIGLLCHKMEKHKEAKSHLILCKLTREKEGWSIPEKITSAISALNQLVGEEVPSSQKEAYAICSSEWHKSLSGERAHQSLDNERTVKKRLVGKIDSIKSDRSYCFINTSDNQSFFCSVSELPSQVHNGDEVYFDAIPSFDNRKKRDSWKAAHIKSLTS